MFKAIVYTHQLSNTPNETPLVTQHELNIAFVHLWLINTAAGKTKQRGNTTSSTKDLFLHLAWSCKNCCSLCKGGRKWGCDNSGVTSPHFKETDSVELLERFFLWGVRVKVTCPSLPKGWFLKCLISSWWINSKNTKNKVKIETRYLKLGYWKLKPDTRKLETKKLKLDTDTKTRYYKLDTRY